MALDVTILIFVSLWSLGVSRECSDTWILGATLDTTATQENKANLSFTRIYLAKNTTQCANDCCLQLHGSCDLAVFTEKANKGTCYHYRCSPIEHCRFKRDNDSEVYLVSVSATENQSLSYLDDTTTPPKSELEIVHGDGTLSKARKGALPDENDPPPPEDGAAAFKHDNTTIVPRKGVPAFSTPALSSNPSSFNVSGASPFLEGQDTAVNFPNFTNFNKVSDKMQFYVEEYNKELENGSTPSADQGNNSAEGDAFIPSDVPSSQHPETTSIATKTFPPPTTTTVLPTPIIVKSQSKPTIEFHTEPVASETTESLNPIPYGLTTKVEEHYHASGTVVQVYQPSHNDLPGDEPDSEEDVFKTNGNMHLVIGLVIGLLVVLLVIGLVAKRMHDSWLRRHYHRMDFLIDGMYHGDP